MTVENQYAKSLLPTTSIPTTTRGRATAWTSQVELRGRLPPLRCLQELCGLRLWRSLLRLMRAPDLLRGDRELVAWLAFSMTDEGQRVEAATAVQLKFGMHGKWNLSLAA